MVIKNSTQHDLPAIFEFYEVARAYMKSKKQVVWPRFPEELIVQEINENRQWKLLINTQIACVWATTLSDELIWGQANTTPAVYIHRIATSAAFRGQNLTKHLVDWADTYCIENNLNCVRLDTVGLNQGLIAHYQKVGFTFLGSYELPNTKGLPDHYNAGPVCLFERKVG